MVFILSAERQKQTGAVRQHFCLEILHLMPHEWKLQHPIPHNLLPCPPSSCHTPTRLSYVLLLHQGWPHYDGQLHPPLSHVMRWSIHTRIFPHTLFRWPQNALELVIYKTFSRREDYSPFLLNSSAGLASFAHHPSPFRFWIFLKNYPSYICGRPPHEGPGSPLAHFYQIAWILTEQAHISIKFLSCAGSWCMLEVVGTGSFSIVHMQSRKLMLEIKIQWTL